MQSGNNTKTTDVPDIVITDKVRSITIEHRKEKNRNSQNDLQIVTITRKVSWSSNEAIERDNEKIKLKVTKDENRNNKGDTSHETQVARKRKKSKNSTL